MSDVDQLKTGRFIAALRRQAGLTQEALGEKVGVTNKTVSRWENGNYMPDLDVLQLLAREFDVSVSELLAGERATDEAFRRTASKNAVTMPCDGVFSFDERKAYYKRRWRREHRLLLVGLAAIAIAVVAVPCACGVPWFAGLAPLVMLIEYGYQNNRMMAYVEDHLYG